MTKVPRRSFLKATAVGGGGLALPALPSSSFAQLPVPPATGRIHRDGPARRAELYALMGDLPDRERPIKAEKRDEREADGYVLESWVLDLNGLRAGAGARREAQGAERASARGAVRPLPRRRLHDRQEGVRRGPAATCSRRRTRRRSRPRATWRLCIDHWCFGERAKETELETVKAMLWQGRVLWGMMVYDSIRALDWLAARADVDPARIGTLGMSMGSTMAQWLAALDERVKATVDICCLTSTTRSSPRRA
jgi:hypothetical protein